MKKIIALAVASAFVAPVMAAELTISGDLNYYISNTDGNETRFDDDEFNLTFAASEAIDHPFITEAGLSVALDMSVNDSSNLSEDGHDIYVKTTYGKLNIGDSASATDFVTDNTDVTEINDRSPNDEGTRNAQMSFTSSINDFITVHVAHSVEDDGVADTAADFTGVAAKVAYGAFTFGVGVDGDTADNNDSVTAYSVRYKNGPLTLAAEQTHQDNNDDGITATGLAAVYSMGGGLSFRAQNLTRETESTEDELNSSTFEVQQNFGNLKIYGGLSTGDDALISDTGSEGQYIGVQYSF